METKLLFQDASQFATPLLAVFAVDTAQGKDAESRPVLLTTSDAITQAAEKFLRTGEFNGALGETLLLHAPGGVKAERLLIVGLGKVKSLSIDQVRKGAGTAVRAAKPRSLPEVAIAFPEDQALADEHLESLPRELTARAIAEGAGLADFDWDTYRSDRKDKSLDTLTVIARASDGPATEAIEAGFAEGSIIARAQNFARTLINEPGNVLNPTVLG